MRPKHLVLASVLTGLFMSLLLGSALASDPSDQAQFKTETIAGMTYLGPSTHPSCVEQAAADTITITRVGSNRLVGHVWVYYMLPDNQRELIKTYEITQTGDLSLTIQYPPLSTWPDIPFSGSIYVTRSVHVDLSIDVSDPLGNRLGTFDGGLDWDVYCSGMPPKSTPTVAPTPTPTPTVAPTPTPTPGGCQAHTIGYWKNHEEAIAPLLPITFGNVRLTQVSDVVGYLQDASAKDATRQLVAQLLAAKLNVACGAPNYCIGSVIADADVFLIAHPRASNPEGADRQYGLTLKDLLDAYNNYGCQ